MTNRDKQAILLADESVAGTSTVFRRADRSRVTPTRIVVFAAVFMPLALQGGAFFVRFLMFFGGAVLAVWPESGLRAVARRVPDGLAITLYVLSTALFTQLLAYTYFIPVFVVTTFLVVLKVTHGEGVLRRWFAWKPVRYLGNISYSFYLVHGLGIELVMSAGGPGGVDLGGPVYLVTTLAASLGVGLVLATVLFVVAEKPYFAWRGVSEVAVRGRHAGARRPGSAADRAMMR